MKDTWDTVFKQLIYFNSIHCQPCLESLPFLIHLVLQLQIFMECFFSYSWSKTHSWNKKKEHKLWTMAHKLWNNGNGDCWLQIRPRIVPFWNTFRNFCFHCFLNILKVYLSFSFNKCSLFQTPNALHNSVFLFYISQIRCPFSGSCRIRLSIKIFCELGDFFLFSEPFLYYFPFVGFN